MSVQRIPSGLSLIAAATLAACSAAPAASAPTTAATTAPTAAPTASPTAVPVALSPNATGSAIAMLVERKRIVSGDVSYIRIAATAGADTAAITATLPEGESFAASYRAASARKDAAGPTLYESADLVAVPAGSYTEALRQIKVLPNGQSAAHKHPGFEVVLVLEGTVQIRTASSAPMTLQKGQGFSILPNVPVQLFNIGGTMVRTLVYTLTTEGQPFATDLETSP